MLRFGFSRVVRGASTTTTPQKLSWNAYFELRRKRRMQERIVAIPTTLLALTLSGSYIANMELDPTATIFGVDPLLAYGIAMVSAGGVGFLLGPVVGSWTWKLQHSDIAHALEQAHPPHTP
jgi:import inner membrane translocase subunit TIM23